MDRIKDISHNLMIIIGIFMYIFGSIGNILNICVFFRWSRSKLNSKVKSNCNRKSNISLYLLISSLSNLIIILYPLLTRIIIDGFQYSVRENDIFILCKFRYYILHTFDLLSLTCICLAIFDQYLISSRKVRLRYLSPTRKGTEQIILFLIILYGIHSIPLGIFFNRSNQGRCIIISIIYLYYYLWIFQLFLHSIIPIIFLTIFGILTFKQLKKLQYTKRDGILTSDKQLSRMLVLMSISIVLSSIPYCIEQIYYVIISNDYLKETSSPFVYFYHVITSILFYTNPLTSFYIFYFSTPNFRKEVKKIIFCRRHSHHRTNRSCTIITQSNYSNEQHFL